MMGRNSIYAASLILDNRDIFEDNVTKQCLMLNDSPVLRRIICERCRLVQVGERRSAAGG
jgi:hypothetical protein